MINIFSKIPDIRITCLSENNEHSIYTKHRIQSSYFSNTGFKKRTRSRA